MTIALVTTFPSNAWNLYAKRALQSFAKYLPEEVQICVQIDDDLCYHELNQILRPKDGIVIGWEKDHADFVARNKDKDSPTDYRKQATRFCHKVFAIKRCLDAINAHKSAKDADPSNVEAAPRYLVWMDADVIINRSVAMDEIKACLPKEGDAVAYLGRKDWPHSECGWLAFDLENGGEKIINRVVEFYTKDLVFSEQQWDDSWIWDLIILNDVIWHPTNLSPEAKGLDAWSSSPMAKWSTHYKGPEAKMALAKERIPQNVKPTQGNKVVIKTKNAIPEEEIRAHIEENQRLITKWIRPCKQTDEEIVFVSAGPMMIPEDLRNERGKKIVAVKHAMEPLKKAGIKIWASILLDPRPHVLNFINEPDKDIIWFVASQVNPEVTKRLLRANCTVWGYHASVNAGEKELTNKQAYAIIGGGSATATRGMYVMNHLGFHNFRLYGYDLCVHDKPDLNAKDEYGQPKYFEISLAVEDAHVKQKKCFWTEPQLLAQFEELQEIVKSGRWHIEAHGDGIIPYIVRHKNLSDLRNKEIVAKITGGKLSTHEELLCLPRTPLTSLRKWLRSNRHKRA